MFELFGQKTFISSTKHGPLNHSKSHDYRNYIAKHLLKGIPEKHTAEWCSNHVAKVFEKTDDPVITKPLLECLAHHAASPSLTMTLKWEILTNLALVPHAFNTWLEHFPAQDLDAQLLNNEKSADHVNLWFLLSLHPNAAISFPSLLRTDQLKKSCLRVLADAHWLTEAPRFDPSDNPDGLHHLTCAIINGGPSWSKALHHAFAKSLHALINDYAAMQGLLKKDQDHHHHHVPAVLAQVNIDHEKRLKRIDDIMVLMAPAIDEKLMCKIYESVPPNSLSAPIIATHCPFLVSQWSRARLAQHLPDGSLPPKSKM